MKYIHGEKRKNISFYNNMILVLKLLCISAPIEALSEYTCSQFIPNISYNSNDEEYYKSFIYSYTKLPINLFIKYLRFIILSFLWEIIFDFFHVSFTSIDIIYLFNQ